jgi:hypothetical protein
MPLEIYKHYTSFPVKRISGDKFQWEEKRVKVDKSEFKDRYYPDCLEEAVEAIKFMSFFVFDDANGLERWLNHGGSQCDFSAETYWQNAFFLYEVKKVNHSES